MRLLGVYGYHLGFGPGGFHEFLRDRRRNGLEKEMNSEMLVDRIESEIQDIVFWHTAAEVSEENVLGLDS